MCARKGKAQGGVVGHAEEPKRLGEENKSLLTENRHLYEQITNLIALQDVALALSSELDLDRLLDRIVRSATDLLHATACSLLLVDEATRELVFEVVLGQKADFLRQQRMSLSKGIAGWVATHGRPTIVNDVSKDRRFRGEMGEFSDFKTASILCAPLAVKGKSIGVIEVLNKTTGPFTREDLGWLAALASQAAIAIDNARLYQRVSDDRNKLITTQEEMRKKLARDLHDGPAQSLSALAMGIDFAKKLYEREPERIQDELESLRLMAVKTSRDIRNLLFELRPLMLESRGLVPTLQSYVNRFGESNGIAIHFDVKGAVDRLPIEVEETLFAIVQEAINNVRKHAHAKGIKLDLGRRGKRLTLSVKDDGQGFDVSAIEADYEQRGSFGLLNMRERASLIGATLRILSEPGKGTTLTLRLPISDETNEASSERLMATV